MRLATYFRSTFFSVFVQYGAPLVERRGFIFFFFTFVVVVRHECMHRRRLLLFLFTGVVLRGYKLDTHVSSARKQAPRVG